MIGPHARQRRFGLPELLIEIGSVDGGQHLSGLHHRPDVVVPALHISVHPRENRRPVKGLDIARQRQRLMAAAGDGRSEGNGRSRLRVGPLHDFLLALRAADEAIAGHDAGKENSGSGRRQQAPPTWDFDTWGLELFRGHGLLFSAQCDDEVAASAGLAVPGWRLCTRLKMVGTRNSVAEVAKISPPITARPSGWFCPASIAIGSIPMTMASAVIRTGRKREAPASNAADVALAPAAIRSRAKLITKMLLAVATPIHMIAPVSAGTESVVPVPNRIQTMPANAVGSAMTMTKGSIQD